MAPPVTRQLPIDDAARALGISRRTIQRRLAAGELHGVKVGSRWLVDVVDVIGVDSDMGESPRGDDNHAIDLAMAELAAMTVERDSLARQVDSLTRERDDIARDKAELARQVDELAEQRTYLRKLLDNQHDYLGVLAGTIAKNLPLLTERTDSRPWWRRFWQR